MSTRPRVLVVTNGYPNPHKPFAGTYLKRHVELHRRWGLDVTVLHPTDSRRGPVRTTWKYLRLCVKAVPTLLFSRFDLVHAHWAFPAGVFGAILSGLRRKPFVLTSHGSYVADLESRPAVVRALVRWAIQRADVVIAVSAGHAQEVQGVADVSEDRVRVIDMGVWLADAGMDVGEARMQLGLDHRRPVIIFVGNLSREKGADILVRAADILRASGKEFSLIIVGEGPQEQDLREATVDSNLEDTVTLIGGVAAEEVYRWLSAADVCVAPSRTEAFGLVALEAMACGTAVVAADVGGLRENIRHGENGLLFRMEDAGQLASCLQTVLTDDSLRECLEAAGRTTAERHDMRLKALEVKRIYMDLLGEGTRSDGVDVPPLS